MEQNNVQSLIYETDQAIQAGRAAHVQAQQALSTLRSTKGWACMICWAAACCRG